MHHKLRPQISTRSLPCYKSTSSGLQAAAVVSNLGALTFPGHSSNASPNSPGISYPGGASSTRTCHLFSLKKSLHPNWASLSSKHNGKNEARGGWRDQQEKIAFRDAQRWLEIPYPYPSRCCLLISFYPNFTRGLRRCAHWPVNVRTHARSPLTQNVKSYSCCCSFLCRVRCCARVSEHLQIPPPSSCSS